MHDVPQRLAVVEATLMHHASEIMQIKDRLFNVLLSVTIGSLGGSGAVVLYVLTKYHGF